MSDRWEVPSIKDELTRKSVETIDWIVNQNQSGQMSDAQAVVAMQTVFSVASGLVGSEVNELIADCRPTSLSRDVIRRVFVDEQNQSMFVFSWEVGTKLIRISSSAKGASPTSREIVVSSAAIGMSQFHAACGSLLRKGFKEIL